MSLARETNKYVKNKNKNRNVCIGMWNERLSGPRSVTCSSPSSSSSRSLANERTRRRSETNDARDAHGYSFLRVCVCVCVCGFTGVYVYNHSVISFSLSYSLCARTNVIRERTYGSAGAYTRADVFSLFLILFSPDMVIEN